MVNSSHSNYCYYLPVVSSSMGMLAAVAADAEAAAVVAAASLVN